MREPVLVLSDLHLGHKVSRLTDPETLRPLLRGKGTVIFNGDTWQELATAFRPRSAALLEELRWICAEEDVDSVFLSGNHDPGFPTGCVELAGGKIVVTHGDALLPAGSPWKREILCAKQRVAEILAENPQAETVLAERIAVARKIASELRSQEFRTGKKFWQRAWDAVVPPERALVMLESWFRHAEAGNGFCDRFFPRAEVLVIGHFHFHGVWRKGRRIIINGGSFMSPDRARWVEFSDGWLREGLIHEKKTGGCITLPPAHVWRF